jgi:hypothetical protein
LATGTGWGLVTKLQHFHLTLHPPFGVDRRSLRRRTRCPSSAPLHKPPLLVGSGEGTSASTPHTFRSPFFGQLRRRSGT